VASALELLVHVDGDHLHDERDEKVVDHEEALLDVLELEGVFEVALPL